MFDRFHGGFPHSDSESESWFKNEFKKYEFFWGFRFLKYICKIHRKYWYIFIKLEPNMYKNVPFAAENCTIYHFYRLANGGTFFSLKLRPRHRISIKTHMVSCGSDVFKDINLFWRKQ